MVKYGKEVMKFGGFRFQKKFGFSKDRLNATVMLFQLNNQHTNDHWLLLKVMTQQNQSVFSCPLYKKL